MYRPTVGIRQTWKSSTHDHSSPVPCESCYLSTSTSYSPDVQASDALQEVDDSEQCLAVPDKVPSLERLQEEDTKQAPAGSENRLTHVTENARLVHALLLQGEPPDEFFSPAGQQGAQGDEALNLQGTRISFLSQAGRRAGLWPDRKALRGEKHGCKRFNLQLFRM